MRKPFVNPKELHKYKNSGKYKQTLSFLGQKILYFHNKSIQKRSQKCPLDVAGTEAGGVGFQQG